MPLLLEVLGAYFPNPSVRTSLNEYMSSFGVKPWKYDSTKVVLRYVSTLIFTFHGLKIQFRAIQRFLDLIAGKSFGKIHADDAARALEMVSPE